jgi:hypothetical protein
MNPFAILLKSRKFWLMVLDVVVSFATYFITKYVNPEMTKDILFVIAGLQPVIVTLIGAIAYEDGKNMEMTGRLGNLDE